MVENLWVYGASRRLFLEYERARGGERTLPQVSQESKRLWGKGGKSGRKGAKEKRSKRERKGAKEKNDRGPLGLARCWSLPLSLLPLFPPFPYSLLFL
jgi:hypothetical protein